MKVINNFKRPPGGAIVMCESAGDYDAATARAALIEQERLNKDAKVEVSEADPDTLKITRKNGTVQELNYGPDNWLDLSVTSLNKIYDENIRYMLEVDFQSLSHEQLGHLEVMVPNTISSCWRMITTLNNAMSQTILFAGAYSDSVIGPMRGQLLRNQERYHKAGMEEATVMLNSMEAIYRDIDIVTVLRRRSYVGRLLTVDDVALTKYTAYDGLKLADKYQTVLELVRDLLERKCESKVNAPYRYKIHSNDLTRGCVGAYRVHSNRDCSENDEAVVLCQELSATLLQAMQCMYECKQSGGYVDSGPVASVVMTVVNLYMLTVMYICGMSVHCDSVVAKEKLKVEYAKQLIAF